MTTTKTATSSTATSPQGGDASQLLRRLRCLFYSKSCSYSRMTRRPLRCRRLGKARFRTEPAARNGSEEQAPLREAARQRLPPAAPWSTTLQQQQLLVGPPRWPSGSKEPTMTTAHFSRPRGLLRRPPLTLRRPSDSVSDLESSHGT